MRTLRSKLRSVSDEREAVIENGAVHSIDQYTGMFTLHIGCTA